MKRYGLLALVVLAGAALILAAARPRSASVAPRAVRAEERVEHALSLVIADGAVVPARIEVPKGAAVLVRVENRDPSAHRFSLLGYESAVSPAALSPGGAATVRFNADRPGSDFAWLLDGKPAGVFVVQGSHLVEGHR
ncbi:MAG TPA: cupredoxin domain-containing protein [Candidatus Eisenbacteria bacterium]|nr:cupredoxin domain-containing protein [Candidatus Eisenbacteria bacterium]